MNICLVNTDFKLGGQQKIVLNLGKQLSLKENKVSFYSFRPEEPFFNIDELEMKIDKTQDELTLFSKLKRKVLRKTIFSNGKANPVVEFKRRHGRLLNYLKEQKIDLVILSGGFLTTFSQSIKEYIPEIKVIAWQHSTAEVYLENYYSEIKDKYLEGLICSDSVVCLTEADRRAFARYNHNTVSISNSVTMNSKVNSVSSNRNDIVFVSRFDVKSKGIDFLIELVNLLPRDVIVKFAGSGTKKQEKIIKEMIVKNDLNDRIILLGALNENELAELYKNGKIFLSTSRWEGFGLSIVEAMTFGLPVISFDTTGPREIIGDDEFGIVIESFDILKMSEAVKKLLSDDVFYKDLSHLAKKRSKDFTPEIIKGKWESHIQDLFKGG
ncbi:hypothetical protein UAW_00193 [Enterococcus haemoperoxidus ATCC BAA-382]|uniref:Glycosyl transferase family 1 domain-containing protein n=1 Tax=Enterococcus haemoperoxidus ATCC BAA-382 TaxID=1158608 RepID=R2T583_9ENTE|nr:glycosyltransferase [Enterococcus haemoperoxidus]EOI00179.1 hypothetical protein UAW_00193 [Enterococcus haemoperoxidus ATCC BAA-382]EOT59583.1 hypothetical protein I583_02218 [Enterococcus haemoperoxidus ATCC BAA-382]OJG52421.1 hypothetical protein RV06_GL000992 [Enterococcus haemoperoxidus]